MTRSNNKDGGGQRHRRERAKTRRAAGVGPDKAVKTRKASPPVAGKASKVSEAARPRGQNSDAVSAAGKRKSNKGRDASIPKGRKLIPRRRGTPRGHSSAASAPGEGYTVGFGRPPREYQFQPGQSGNGGGRQKGSKNFKTIVNEILDSKITITRDGKQKKLPARYVIVLKTLQQAMSGDARARKDMLILLERYAPNEPISDAPVSAADAEIIETFRRDIYEQALADVTAANAVVEGLVLPPNPYAESAGQSPHGPSTPPEPDASG